MHTSLLGLHNTCMYIHVGSNLFVCILAYYNTLSHSASVSVLTIKGTECDLIHLGQVASISGGNVMLINLKRTHSFKLVFIFVIFFFFLQVDVVDPLSIMDEFVNILSTSVVAVNANARVMLHSSL